MATRRKTKPQQTEVTPKQEKKMQQFEYMYVNPTQMSEGYLNSLGKNGWELVGFTPNLNNAGEEDESYLNRNLAVFKRTVS